MHDRFGDQALAGSAMTGGEADDRNRPKAVETDGQAIAVAQAALKSGGVI